MFSPRIEAATPDILLCHYRLKGRLTAPGPSLTLPARKGYIPGRALPPALTRVIRSSEWAA